MHLSKIFGNLLSINSEGQQTHVYDQRHVNLFGIYLVRMPRIFKRVVCGVSGGVDSAVSALFLKSKGFDVLGVFMKNWDQKDEFGVCTADRDFEDVQVVCKKLDIPLKQINFVQNYWNEVFSEFLHGYEHGYTPNPDILCNKEIKFRNFFDYAINDLGADAIATGHYVRSSAGQFLEHIKPDKGVDLLVARDRWKDQSFFLSQVPQHALQKTMFPIGDFLKSDVKKIAKETGLEKIAKKKESMGLCFIGSRQFQHFISLYIDDKPGNFVDFETRDVVGEHKGIHHWTLGQRAKIGGCAKPYFVVDKNIQTGDIFVVQGTNHPALYTQVFFTSEPHWIHQPPRVLMQEQMWDCEYKVQRKVSPTPCTVTLGGGNSLIVSLQQPHRSITPGQYAVFYKGDVCYGSARILRSGASLYTMGQRSQVIGGIGSEKHLKRTKDEST